MGSVSSRGFSGEGKSPRRSWRGGTGTDPRPPRGSAQPSWATGGQTGGGGVRRWGVGVLWTAIALALVGGFLVFVFIRPRATPLVCFHVTGYEAPLVPQAFAQEDVERMTQLFFSSGLSAGQISTGSTAEVKPAEADSAEEFLDDLVKRVRREVPGGPDNVVLIYLSAQGMVDADGRPCLLAAATPRVEKELAQAPTPDEILKRERLVDLKTLLDLLKKEHPQAWKVVLLDAVRWERNWRLGQPENRFADALRQEMARLSPSKNSDRVVVINSCSDGEIGLADPVQERTLFGDYVASGLAGEADKLRDGQIGLVELADYLADQVAAAAQRRGRSQLPQLVLPGAPGKTIDFALARTRRPAVSPRWAGGDIPRRVTDFADKWKRLPARGGARGRLAAPLVTPLERARQELLRHEAILLGGKAYKDETEPELPNNWPGEVELQPPAVSLPLSLPATHEPLPAIESGAQGWANRFAPFPADQPDPVAGLLPHEKLYGLWGALRRGGAAEHLLPRAGLPRTAVLPVELHTWIRFHDDNLHLPEKLKAGGGESRFLENYLDCRQLAEGAAFCGGDERVYRWVAGAVEAGDDARRQAEDMAFAGAAEAELLKQLSAAQESYERAVTTAEEVALAFALRDQALANLPYWLEWCSAGDAARQQLGLDLIDAAAELELLLDEPQAGDDSKLVASKDKLKELLAALDASLEEVTTHCLDASFHLGYLPELEQLLAVPLADPALRQRLWEKYFLVLESDRTQATAAGKKPQVLTPRSSAKTLFARWLEKRAAGDTSLQSLATLGRDELLKDEKDFDPAEPELRKQLARADRTIRGLAPWLTLVAVKQPAGDVADPATGRRGRHGAVLRDECARHDYYLWQASRFLADFLGNDDGAYRSLAALTGQDPLEPYFAAASSQLIDHAGRLFPREQQSAPQQQLAEKRAAAAALARHFSQSLTPASDGLAAPDLVVTQVQGADPAVQQVAAGQGALWLAGAEFERDASGVTVNLKPPRDPSQPPPGRIGFPVPGPLAGSSPPRILPGQFKFLLPAEPPSEPWKIAAYYRGHAGAVDLALDRPGYVILAKRSPERGKLTVNSSLTDGTVVIVLDCSKSMDDGNRQWMGHAVEAVKRIMDELLDTGKIEVALVLFSHRRGIPEKFNPNGPTTLPWNSDFPGDPNTILFEDDFDVVWKGTSWNSRLDHILGTEARPSIVRAQGYTPLFSAVRHAAMNGFSLDRKGARSLVIVSDGGDGIGIPDPPKETIPQWIRDRSYNTDDQRKARAAAALEAMKQFGNIETSIVYLASQAPDPRNAKEVEKAKWERDAVEMARRGLKIARSFDVERSRGDDRAQDVEKLVGHLKESVGIHSYQVVAPSREAFPSSTARTTTYTQYGRSTIEWGGDVRAAFELVGDESLQAEIRREGNQRRVFFLGGEDLDADSAAQRVQLDAAEKSDLSQERLYPQEYLVGCRAARPLVGDRHRTFQVAFRAGDPGRFTPRPREVWVEIVPAELDKDGKPAAMASAEPYFIAQPAYAAGSSYPVAELNAPNWPAGAEAALVKVWFRMTDSREVTKLDESGLRRPNASGFAGGGFAYGLEYLEPRKQWAIRVVESQSRSPGQQPAWSLVTLEGTPADEVERRFFTDAGRVEHFFIFRDLQKSDLAKRAVNIVPQQIWKESATAVPKEFTVVIPRN